GTAPLFTALFNYRHSVPNTDAAWFSTEGIRTLASQERTNYPITLSLDDMGEDFVMLAQTDRRVDPQRVLGYLKTALHSLLEALAAAPDARALRLEVLPRDERLAVLESFNDTRREYPTTALVHRLFEEQVVRSPQFPAVSYGPDSLTYAELNRRANQL